MAVIRCSKGHYYDDAKFAQCPHCGVLPEAEPEKPVKAKRFGFFRKDTQPHGAAGTAQNIPNIPGPEPGPAAAPAGYDDLTVGIAPQFSGSGPADDDRTMAFNQPGGGFGGDDGNRTIAFGPGTGSVPDDDNRTIAFGRSTGSVPDDDNRTIAFTRPPEPDPDPAGRAASPGPAQVKKPAPKPALAREAGNVSPEPALPLSPDQYVAGWLVCIKGEAKGKDYRLYKGFNRMGSQANADIRLIGEDAGITCAVVYDDRGNRFYIAPQKGGELYLNEEKVQGASGLSTGDIIRAGSSEYEFVAFCREKRTWSENE